MNRFDLAAKDWDSKSNRVNIAKTAVENIENIIDIKGLDILDYGCGTGLIAFGLSQNAKNVLGMDSSNGMLDVFNKKAKELGFENAASMKHDANHDELPKCSFDLIVTSMTLHHIKDTDAFVKKCKYSLRPGGYLCISDLNEEDGKFHDKGNEGVEHFGFSKETIADLYNDNGFELIYLEDIFSVSKPSKEYPVFLAIGKII